MMLQLIINRGKAFFHRSQKVDILFQRAEFHSGIFALARFFDCLDGSNGRPATVIAHAIEQCIIVKLRQKLGKSLPIFFHSAIDAVFSAAIGGKNLHG